MVLAVVVDAGQQAAHGLQPRALLVVALDHGPGRVGRVGPGEHRDLGRGVGIPLVQQRDVGGAELPLPHRVDLADGEPGVLLTGGDGEPELRQRDAVVHQQPLELQAPA